MALRAQPRPAPMAVALTAALSLFAIAPLGAQPRTSVSHHGAVQARSGASVRQSPQRVRTSFDLSGPRVDERVSREDLTSEAVPIPRQMQGIGQPVDSADRRGEAPAQVTSNAPRVRVLGAGGDQTVASVRQSRAAAEERERRESYAEAPRAPSLSNQPLPAYVRYGSSTDPTFDFSVPPPVGAVVCDGLPLGVDRFTHDGTRYYSYAGSCLTRIYQGGTVCYRVVPCPER